MSSFYSTRQVAEIFGVETWRVQRLFEDGTLPEPDRFAGKRCIPSSLMPAVTDALRSRGWLPNQESVRV